MSTTDAINQLLPAPRQSAPTPAPANRLPNLAGRRARATVNAPDDFPSFGSMTIVPPPDAESSWRTLNLDSKTLSRMSPADLMVRLADISPEISKALDDMVLMVDPGHEWHAYRPGSEDVDARSQAALDAFFTLLRDLYGSQKVPISRLIIGLGLRGALFAELVLDQAGRLPVDLATPDPYSARFRKVTDPARGTIWKLGQYQPGGWTELDYPTVSYLPYHPAPNSPYGRTPFGAAVFSAVFLLVMLHDLRRVVQQQGYPRLDLAVAMEQLRETMPGDIEIGSQEFKEWVDAAIDEVADAYSTLQPDDAYVHTDIISVNRPVGTVDSSSLGAIDGLFSALERMIARGLKSNPLLMNLSDSASETEANRQWEIYAARISSMQQLLEAQLEKLLTVMLQAQGLQATVQFRFAKLRAAEELRDAQAESMKISNASAQYEAGWISQDEAAQKGAGKDKADQPKPRRAAQPAQLTQGDGDGEPVTDDEERFVFTPEFEQQLRSVIRRNVAELRGANGYK